MIRTAVALILSLSSCLARSLPPPTSAFKYLLVVLTEEDVPPGIVWPLGAEMSAAMRKMVSEVDVDFLRVFEPDLLLPFPGDALEGDPGDHCDLHDAILKGANHSRLTSAVKEVREEASLLPGKKILLP